MLLCCCCGEQDAFWILIFGSETTKKPNPKTVSVIQLTRVHLFEVESESNLSKVSGAESSPVLKLSTHGN